MPVKRARSLRRWATSAAAPSPTINATGSLRDILVRNYSAGAVGRNHISMTQENWTFI